MMTKEEFFKLVPYENGRYYCAETNINCYDCPFDSVCDNEKIRKEHLKIKLKKFLT